MRKVGMLLLCSAALLLGACQGQISQQTGQSESALQRPEKSSAKTLHQGVWEDKLYTKLTKLIKENGKTSPAYDPDKRPYAVFDWDNTSVINDIGEATFTYQITNLAFKMTPEQFSEAIRMNLPQDNFTEEYNNKAGQAVNADKIAVDLLSDYTVLYNEYKGMKGSKSLQEVKKLEAYQDFKAKLRYLYEAIGDSFSSDVSYPWVTYLYAGMTPEDVRRLSKKSIDDALKDDLTYETWESPEALKGQSGQVSVTFKRGVRSVKEVQNLYEVLMANGIDVYICSASYYDVVYTYATNSKYGYNIPKENIYAMMLAKDKNNLIQYQLDSEYFQTQGKGKTETIKQRIAVNHGGRSPILIAGDSNGDYNMMQDFPDMQMGIIFNLLRTPNQGIAILAQEAANTYGKEDAKYFLQGRDENKGVLLPDRKTIQLEKTEAQLMKE